MATRRSRRLNSDSQEGRPLPSEPEPLSSVETRAARASIFRSPPRIVPDTEMATRRLRYVNSDSQEGSPLASEPELPSSVVTTAAKPSSVDTIAAPPSIFRSPPRIVPDAEMALAASLSWKSSSKDIHPLDEFLLRYQQEGHSKGWLRRAYWGDARRHFNDAQKHRITMYRSMLCGTRVKGAAEKLAFAFGVTEKTIRTISTFTFDEKIPSSSTDIRSLSRTASEASQLTEDTLLLESRSWSSGSTITRVESLESYVASIEDGVTYEENSMILLPADTLLQSLQQIQAQTMRAQADEDGIVSLSYKAKNGRNINMTYASLPQARDKPGEEVKDDTLYRRAKKMYRILKNTNNSEETQLKVMKKFVKMIGATLVLPNELMLSLTECEALMLWNNESANAIYRLDRFFRRVKGLRLFPTRIRMRLAEYELQGVVDAVVSRHQLIVDKSGTTASCVGWHLVDPWAMLEKLVVCAICSKKFAKSETFSRLINKIVMVFGADRGGNETTMYLRVANRDSGNKGSYSQPISQYELGLECYENLAATIFHEAKLIRQFLQDLVDDTCYFLSITVMDNEGSVDDCRGLVFKPVADLPLEQLSVSVTVNIDEKDIPTADGFHPALDLRVEDRSEVTKIVFPPALQLNSELILTIRPVWKDESLREIIGFKLFTAHANEPIFSMAFKEPMLSSDDGAYTASFSHVVGFPSHDVKQGLLVSGQSSASSSCPCLVCNSHKADFAFPPSWMADVDPERFSEDACRQFVARDGENSNDKSNERWKRLTCDNSKKLSDADDLDFKCRCFSVTKPPLLLIPPHKDPTAPMHGPQGILTHTLDETRAKLKAIDNKGDFVSHVVQAVLNDVDAAAKETREYKNRQSKVKRMQDAVRGLERAAIEHHNNAPLVASYKEQIQTQNEKIDTFILESGHGTATKLRRGAKTLKEKIGKYRGKDSSIPRGQAEYVFNRAIEIVGCVKYNVQHGGKELSHRDGMKVMAKLDEIIATVSNVYVNKPELQAAVANVMAQLKLIVTPLLALSKLMKSQDKITAIKQLEMKKDLCELFYQWRAAFPTRPIFNKLHHAIVHAPPFIGMHGMYGRLSEEGFEAAHPLMAKLKAITRSMVDSTQRVQVEIRRGQQQMNLDVAQVHEKVAAKSKERGTYNCTRSTRAQEATTIEDAEDNSIEGYFAMPGNALCKEEWREIYNLVCLGMVPDQWHQTFESDESLGVGTKEDAKYLK